MNDDTHEECEQTMKKTIEVVRSIMGKPAESMKIKAEVFGLLAVHPTISKEIYGWTVTHIPSGWAVKAQVEDKSKAVELAKALSHLPWEKVSAERFPNKIRKEAIEIIKSVMGVKP